MTYRKPLLLTTRKPRRFPPNGTAVVVRAPAGSVRRVDRRKVAWPSAATEYEQFEDPSSPASSRSAVPVRHVSAPDASNSDLGGEPRL